MSLFPKRGLEVSGSRGFTLIELLVVVAIIGILSSIVLASLNSARKKGRDARRVSDIKQLQLALELYYDSCNRYPNVAQFSATGAGCIGNSAGLVGNGFISTLPKDPSTGANYSYAANGTATNCSSYHLGATLELTTHPALANDADADVAATCTGGIPEFSGLSAGSTCDSTPGTAQPGGTETCYDVKP